MPWSDVPPILAPGCRIARGLRRRQSFGRLDSRSEPGCPLSRGRAGRNEAPEQWFRRWLATRVDRPTTCDYTRLREFPMTETVVFSLRLDPEQVERIDNLMERRHRMLYPLPAPATRSRMAKLNRADTVRWLLE